MPVNTEVDREADTEAGSGEDAGLGDIIAALIRDGDSWRGRIPDGWLQGRTSYGGLSSALALHVAQGTDADLPPLRSAQISFIGPLAGEVTIRARPLRRGRNAAFIQAEIEGAAGVGLSAIFVFMGAIASRLVHEEGRAPPFPPPRPGDRTLKGLPAVRFTRQFEMVDRQEGLRAAEWLRWCRLDRRDGIDPMVELVAVADCLPPAALKLLGGPAPVSSVTWLLNLLTPRPTTTDGWWLLHSHADHARDGCSSQTMRIWNADGEPVAEQMQSVALFA